MREEFKTFYKHLPLHRTDKAKCETDSALYPVKGFTRELLFLAPFRLLRTEVGPSLFAPGGFPSHVSDVRVPTSSSDLPLRCAANTTLNGKVSSLWKTGIERLSRALKALKGHSKVTGNFLEQCLKQYLVSWICKKDTLLLVSPNFPGSLKAWVSQWKNSGEVSLSI